MWKDVTSYSQNGDRTPKSWQLNLGDFRVTITCGHLYYPGEWVAHCDPFFREKKLDVEAVDQAKAKAISMVRERLERAVAALPQPAAAPLARPFNR